MLASAGLINSQVKQVGPCIHWDCKARRLVLGSIVFLLSRYAAFATSNFQMCIAKPIFLLDL